MNVHEYQGQSSVPRLRHSCGGWALPAETPAQAYRGGRNIGRGRSSLKHRSTPAAAGRPAASEPPKHPNKLRCPARAMLGSLLVTKQTGPAGKTVHKVYVEKAVRTVRELYFSILIDPLAACPVIVASTCGGTDIERVANETPECVLRTEIDPLTGLCGYQGWELADALDIPQELKKNFVQLVRNAYRLFCEKGLRSAGNQPAGGHRRRQIMCAGCQAGLRFRRPVQASGHHCAAGTEARSSRWKPAHSTPD